MQADSEILTYHKDEAHIIRRLGIAIIFLWDELPEKEREKIQSRALQVNDELETVGLNEQLRSFLAQYAGKRLAPPSSAKWPTRKA